MDEIHKELAGKKVLIVDDEAEFTEMLEEQLKSVGMNVVGVARSGVEALKLSEETAPALIIMDIKLPGNNGEPDGIETARMINESNDPRAILVLSGFSEGDYIRRSKIAGVSAYLVKPQPLQALLPSIILAMERFKELMKLKAEIGILIETIENRKIIERAKGVLMETKNMSEKEAYTYLRTCSQKESKPMAEIARMLVAFKDLLQAH